jgi:molybdopterin-guanine dinucleotide biosynthesis protein A
MCSAAILAGGRATRFGGRDKSALMVDGRTILDRQIDVLSEVTDDVLIVGGQQRHQRARLVQDQYAGYGPLGGLHAALADARSTPVFVVGCDMPYVTSALVAHLLERAADVDAVVPRTERGLHPLCAVYTRGCLDAVARRLANGQLKMLDLLAELRTRVVSGEEIDRFGDRHRLLANVNTPGEYASLEAFQGHTL